jgi:hypothetical protein
MLSPECKTNSQILGRKCGRAQIFRGDSNYGFMHEVIRRRLNYLYARCADQSGRGMSAMKCHCPLRHWGRGFEFQSRNGCIPCFLGCSRRMRWTRPIARMGDMRYVYRIISGNPKVHVGYRAVCRSIRYLDHLDVACENINWIPVTQDRVAGFRSSREYLQ